MGVDLNLWALDKGNKTYVKYELERTSAVWDEIKSLPSMALANDFDEYAAYAFYGQINSKGPGRRQKQELVFRKRKIIPKERPVDAYGENLVTVEALYLKILASGDSIRFQNEFEKAEFLKLNDNAQVVLYWH